MTSYELEEEFDPAALGLQPYQSYQSQPIPQLPLPTLDPPISLTTSLAGRDASASPRRPIQENIGDSPIHISQGPFRLALSPPGLTPHDRHGPPSLSPTSPLRPSTADPASGQSSNAGTRYPFQAFHGEAGPDERVLVPSSPLEAPAEVIATFGYNGTDDGAGIRDAVAVDDRKAQDLQTAEQHIAAESDSGPEDQRDGKAYGLVIRNEPVRDEDTMSGVKEKDFGQDQVSQGADEKPLMNESDQRTGDALMAKTASAMTSTTLADELTGDESILTTSTKRSATKPRPRLARHTKSGNRKARLVVLKRPNGASRLSVRVTTRPVPPSRPASFSQISSRSRDPTPPAAPAPPSDLTRDVANTFSPSVFSTITSLAEAHNTSGHLLPMVLRDFFPAMTDRRKAVELANEVRSHLSLPLLSHRTDRVALQKALARTRERLYTELYSALILPLAPEPTPATLPVSAEGEVMEDRSKEEKSLSLTPTSLHHLSIHLPKSFPGEAKLIRQFFREELENGEEGKVIWVDGVGRMADGRGKKEGARGYRGELGEGEAGVHVFVDHSNIHHGLLHSLYSSALPLPPRHARTLSLPCLSLLLRRGRHTPPGTMHLVASSPLHQDLDVLVKLGWEVSVLKRVEVYAEEVRDLGAGKLVPRGTTGVVEGPKTLGVKMPEGSQGVVPRVASVGDAKVLTGNEIHGDAASGNTAEGSSTAPASSKANVPDISESAIDKDKSTMATKPQETAEQKGTAFDGPTSGLSDSMRSNDNHGAAPSSATLGSVPSLLLSTTPAPGLRRYREQGVDEILTLKLLQTIFSIDIPAPHHPLTTEIASSSDEQHPSPSPSPSDPRLKSKTRIKHMNPPLPLPFPSQARAESKPGPGTIVLATGDARGGQFNAGGFLGAVKHAIKRGWVVELWSFGSGMSRQWKETAKREGWGGGVFRMYRMDGWGEWLVDVNEDLMD